MFQKLIDWSCQEFSYLPWRKNRSLYGTLVSEIMLQQTTVSTVINHFERFLNEYPTPKDVASASEEELLISWKGLGYYRRARNLQKACRTITNKYGGEIPLDFDKLIQIDGIGIYTANALIAIGANKRALAVDANLERVLARLNGIEIEKGLKLQKEILQKFKDDRICSEMNQFGAREYNEALMDLGRNYCQARKAHCDLCPLSSICVAFNEKKVEQIPNIVKKKAEFFELEVLRIILKKDDKYLSYKKNESEWLSGQYEVPTFVISCEDDSFKQYPKIDGDFSFLPEIKTSITKYKIRNKVLWVNETEIKKLGLKLSDFTFTDKNLSTASMKSINL